MLLCYTFAFGGEGIVGNGGQDYIGEIPSISYFSINFSFFTKGKVDSDVLVSYTLILQTIGRI